MNTLFCLTPGTYLITGANAPDRARNRFSFSQPRDTGPEAYCYSSVPACQSPLAVRKKVPQLCRRGPHFRKRVQRYALFPDPPNFSQTFFKKNAFLHKRNAKRRSTGRSGHLFIIAYARAGANGRGLITEKAEKTNKHFVSGNFDISGYFRNRRYFMSRKRRKGRKGRKCCFELFELSSKKLRTFCYKRQRRQLGTTCLSRIGEFEKLYSFYL